MAQRPDPRSLSGHARLVPRRQGDAPRRPASPLTDPRVAAPAPRREDPRLLAAGRRAGLALAGTGLFWIAATWLGTAYDWSPRLRGLLDLAALAGFGVALYLTWQVWRLRRADRARNTKG